MPHSSRDIATRWNPPNDQYIILFPAPAPLRIHGAIKNRWQHAPPASPASRGQARGSARGQARGPARGQPAPGVGPGAGAGRGPAVQDLTHFTRNLIEAEIIKDSKPKAKSAAAAC